MSDRPHITLDVSAVPAKPAGAGIYVSRVVAALAATDDVDLELVTTRDDIERWRALAPAAGLHPIVPARRPFRLAWEQARGPTVAQRLGTDLWHGPHYTLPLRAPGILVATIHDLTFFDHPEWHERNKVVYFRRMIAATTRRADLLLAVSDATARRLHELLEPAAPVRVAPLGVDHARFRPRTALGVAVEAHIGSTSPHGEAPSDDADQRLLAEYGIRPPFVAFLGTLEPRKGVPTLVAAFSRMASGRPDLQLVLAGGPGWGVEDIELAIAASPVADRIVRPGYVSSEVPPALLRQAAAVAYPSFEEGFGLPTLEALACGAALVTTEGSVMAELVGDAAALVPAGDVEALADTLAALVDDADGRATALRRAGPVRAAPFTWEACAAGHVAAYREALTTR